MPRVTSPNRAHNSWGRMRRLPTPSPARQKGFSSFDNVERNSGSTAATRSRNLSSSWRRASPRPVATAEEGGTDCADFNQVAAGTDWICVNNPPAHFLSSRIRLSGSLFALRRLETLRAVRHLIQEFGKYWPSDFSLFRWGSCCPASSPPSRTRLQRVIGAGAFSAIWRLRHADRELGVERRVRHVRHLVELAHD